MIYLDTSVALAQLLAEDCVPPPQLWDADLAASRLLEYEIWTRLHARGLGASHAESARKLIGRVALLELLPAVLSRALEPFPTAVRTLDALHLASVDFLQQQGQAVQLASYDDRMLKAAAAMSIEVYPV
jgi:hypothetical protein